MIGAQLPIFKNAYFSRILGNLPGRWFREKIWSEFPTPEICEFAKMVKTDIGRDRLPAGRPDWIAPLYDGRRAAFVIFDIAINSPTPVGDVNSVITDGNQVEARDLVDGEAHLRKANRLKGRPRGGATTESEILITWAERNGSWI